MKKLLFTALIVLVSANTIKASNTIEAPIKTSVEYVKLSTFCEMIKQGNYESVKAFINNGTNINRKSMGLTPVMFAARYNKVKILKLLISNGAKLKTKSNKGYTALQYAKMSKANEAYEVLKVALEKN
ncbi:ankyrin repeat domain-containing protein [Tenacibaculum halocynthiae]|uniref:ankyrin repeat domain-containing protein n=1 Tax=Tenacibaculum halocynthiae TaxID=1254437 RepID=UPI003D64BDC6